MLFPSNVTDYVCKGVQWADRQIRSELRDGYIATENDYTSNLTGTIRRQINGYGFAGLYAQSVVLKPGIERKAGADACIIFATTTEFKIGMFEAKWPRLSTHTNCWDSIQKSTGESHFHSQLRRQAPFNGRFAIWEMFYMEHPYKAQPAGFPDYHSACFWHDDVYPVSTGRAPNTPWEDHELLMLAPVHHIGEIVREICECRKGMPIPGTDYARAFENLPNAPTSALLIKYDNRVVAPAIG